MGVLNVTPLDVLQLHQSACEYGVCRLHLTKAGPSCCFPVRLPAMPTPFRTKYWHEKLSLPPVKNVFFFLFRQFVLRCAD